MKCTPEALGLVLLDCAQQDLDPYAVLMGFLMASSTIMDGASAEDIEESATTLLREFQKEYPNGRPPNTPENQE